MTHEAPSSSALDGAARARFASIASIVLPGTRLAPSASAIQIGDAPLDRVLRACPELTATLRDALARTGAAEPAEALRTLQAQTPRVFSTLMLIIVAAYYLAPEARAAVGYDGQQALPIDEFELTPSTEFD